MFLAPTPGSSNGEESVTGTLGDLGFPSSGFYDEESMFVGIYSFDSDVDIYYTTDGSELIQTHTNIREFQYI